MNRYSLWRYIFLGLLILISILYALPNLYGEDYAIQVQPKGSVLLTPRLADQITGALQTQQIPYKSIAHQPYSYLIRFRDPEDQLKAQDILQAVARVNPLTKTPLIPTLVTGAIVAVLAGIVPIDIGIALTNIGTLSAFTIVCVGVLVLRRTKPNAVRPFRAPFGMVSAALGAILCLYLMIGGLSGGTWLRFIIWFAVGVAVYAAYGFRHSRLRDRA